MYHPLCSLFTDSAVYDCIIVHDNFENDSENYLRLLKSNGLLITDSSVSLTDFTYTYSVDFDGKKCVYLYTNSSVNPNAKGVKRKLQLVKEKLLVDKIPPSMTSKVSNCLERLKLTDS